MALKSIKSYRLVKSEDLNHHKTLFAGRCAEWFVEAAFVTVSTELDPHHVVCLKIHGMEFLRPIRSGDVLTFNSTIVNAGRSTLAVYVRVTESKAPDEIFCDGFITFCYVDDNTKSIPHGLRVEPETMEEILLNETARNLELQQRKAGRM